MRELNTISHVSGNFIALLFTTLMLAMTAFAQTQDITPPVLQSFSFTPATIEVTGGDQTVTVTEHVTEDLSGFSFGCVGFLSPSTQQGRSACIDGSTRTSGDDKDGVYQGTAIFPQFSEAGTWHVSYVYLYDRIGNRQYYEEAQLIAAGFQTTLDVTATPDTLPPVLQGFSFTPTTIDTSTADQTVTVTEHVTEDLSGFSFGCVGFFSPSTQQGRSACIDSSTRTSGDDKDGVYQGTAIFPQFSEAGTWHVSYVYLYDRIGNRRYYEEAQLIAAGFQTTLDVASNPSDTAPPILQAFGFAPYIVNTTTGDASVIVTEHVTEDLSGFSFGCVGFFSPSTQQGRSACIDSSTRTSGDDKDGVYQGTAILPQFSEAGTWRVSYVYLYDRIGNRKYYEEAQLIAAGFPTTLQVSVGQPPVANAGPDQTVEATAPLTNVTLNGSASSDPDGDALSFEWRNGSGNVVGTTAVVSVTLGLGTQAFTLTVNDGHGNSATDSVTVTVRDTTAPTVTVTRPNGGEKLLTGSAYTIEWTANDNVGVSSFSAFISVNGGGTFNPIPGCTAVSGALRSCVWSAPGPTTNAGRILVMAADAAGHTGTDASDANFSIATGTGSITVTAPNTATVDWGEGSTQQIKWSHNLGLQSYVRIELSRDAGETWEALSSSFKNTAAASGVFNWVVTGPTIEDAVRIRVSGLNFAATDEGDADFTISAPYVVAATPNTTATNLGYGSARKQTWITNLGPLDKVDVVLSTDGGATFPVMLASSVTATTKTANFTTPILDAPAAAGRIGVRWTSNGAVTGMNPVNIKVQPAYIKVTSPNLSSNVWTVGSTPMLTWSNNLGTSENVKVELSLDGGASYPIILLGSTPSDGSESVSVQTGWVTTNARVRISWVRDAGVSDVSYQPFVIR